jgi:hypothetical protein
MASAAWLYDLLKPRVTKVVACDPRKDRSMREGNHNDKIDARRLAELLRLHHLNPVYHGLRTLKQLARSYLTVTKDLGLCDTPSRRVVSEDHGTGSVPAGQVLLPTTGCAAIAAPGSAAGSARGKQEAQDLESPTHRQQRLKPSCDSQARQAKSRTELRHRSRKNVAPNFDQR